MRQVALTRPVPRREILQRDCWIKLANKLEFTEWAKGASRREIPR
jgi:hypothetical protein